MSDNYRAIISHLIAQPAVLRGLLLALYIILAIVSYALAASRRRNPLTLLALLMIFGLSSLQIAHLTIPQNDWLMSQKTIPSELIIVAPEIQAREHEEIKAIEHDWSRVWPTVARWQDEFERAASYCGVDPLLAAAVSARESSGNPSTCSTQGACGLMGLMPGTAASLGVTNRLDPQENILGGSCYLGQMFSRYGRLDLALAAYNAGPGNVEKYGGIPPFTETKVYVRDVLKFYAEYSALPPSPPAAQLDKFPSAPVAGTYLITQAYHAGHPGLDIARFTTVVAVMEGVVRYVGPLYRSADGAPSCATAGCLGRFGIVLDHGGGTFTVYGHNSCAYVQAGEVVRAGQALACIGSEGKSSGPHLHFELRVGEVWNGEPGWPWRGSYNSAIDPTSYLP